MTRTPKKSETLDIRLPYSTKRAFMDQCQAEGRGASETLRAYIDRHLETASATVARRARGQRRLVQLAAGLAVTIGAGAVALPSLAATAVRAEFVSLDSNRDETLTVKELVSSAKVQVEVTIAGREIARGAPEASTSVRSVGSAEVAEKILRQKLARVDLNGDGVLTYPEYRRARNSGSL